MLLGVLAVSWACFTAPAGNARWRAFDCFRRDLTGEQCPRLALAQPCKGKRCLEPSGLAYDKEHKIWVGVSDNYDDLILEGPATAGNVVFWFREETGAGGIIAVRPLLSAEQAAAFPLYDLEGVTRAEDGTYLATGSWSLGDSPYRDRMLSFRVVADGRGGFAATQLAWIAPGGDADLRRWLVEKSGLTWTAAEVAGKPEKGGINLEALAFATSPANTPRSVLFGLRGPDRPAARGSEIWLLRATLGADDDLRCESLSRAVIAGGVSAFGLRAIEGMAEVPGAYLYLLGPSGGDYSPTYAGVALPGQETIELGSLVQLTNGVGVVPEGIAAESVRDLGDGRVEVTFAAVDDVSCRFQKGTLVFRRPSSPASAPFRVQPCVAKP
jgi:hypothetical protein